MDAWSILLQVVLLLALATLLGLAVQRLGQNAITGYLLAGVLLGPLSQRAAGGAAIRLLAEVGVALLLFTIGLEFSLGRLRALGARVTLLGVLQVGGTTALVAAGARPFGLNWRQAVLVGTAAAMSSTSVVLRLISERSELDSGHGRAAMGVSLLQDLAVVPAMLLVPLLAGSAGGMEGLLAFGMAVMKALALLAGLYVVMRWIVPGVMMRAAGAQNRDLPVLLAAVVCLGSSWASHSLGLSAVLGAFAAGIILSECALAEQIRADVIPLRAAFLPLFFTSVGMLASLPDWRDAGWMLALAAGVMIVKTAVVLALGVALRMRPEDACRAGLMLAQVGEFSFVLLESARRAGLLEETIYRLLLSVSVVTLVLSPLLAAASPATASVLETLLGSRTRRGVAVSASAADGPRGHVIVIGYGPAGQQVVQRLRSEGISVLVIDLNPRTAATSSAGLPITYGDATQQEVLERAGVARAAAVVVTVPDPLTARNIIAQARRLAPEAPVIARARYHIHQQTLAEAGSNRLVSEEVVVGRELAGETLAAMGRG